MSRTFGHIEGYPPGAAFENRKHLSEAGVHRPTQAGISGSQAMGADSIVLSGGYEDDEDLGSIVIYTGAGGRNETSGLQEKSQLLTRTNMALAKSRSEGLPVRVIRGASHNSPFSPNTGYRYDGLYYVDDYWREKGKSGFYVWRFRLVQENYSQSKIQFKDSSIEDLSKRRTYIQQRIVRSTFIARRVKEIYNHRCQVCGLTIPTKSGSYAEAAHIKPLGRPHNGPDIPENILCLCPNHHVMFDNGFFLIEDDLSLINLSGKLTVHSSHRIAQEFIQYHREHYSGDYQPGAETGFDSSC